MGADIADIGHGTVGPVRLLGRIALGSRDPDVPAGQGCPVVFFFRTPGPYGQGQRVHGQLAVDGPDMEAVVHFPAFPIHDGIARDGVKARAGFRPTADGSDQDGKFRRQTRNQHVVRPAERFPVVILGGAGRRQDNLAGIHPVVVLLLLVGILARFVRGFLLYNGICARGPGPFDPFRRRTDLLSNESADVIPFQARHHRDGIGSPAFQGQLFAG